MSDIFRAPSEAERKDYQVVGENDYKRVFQKNLLKAEKDYQLKKNYEPFDRNGAQFDFEDAERNLIENSMRSTGAVDAREIMELVKNFDFTRYEGREGWDLIGTKPLLDKLMINGKQVTQQTGMWMEYRHMKYNKIHQSIEVPMDVYKEKFEGKEETSTTKSAKNNKPVVVKDDIPSSPGIKAPQ